MGAVVMNFRRVKAAMGAADMNQSAIKARAKELGFDVVDLSPVGGGCPDLLISTPIEMWLVEVKRLEVKGSSSEFREKQYEFYDKWDGREILIWYELGDVDLLFMCCYLCGHFSGRLLNKAQRDLINGEPQNLCHEGPKRQDPKPLHEVTMRAPLVFQDISGVFVGMGKLRRRSVVVSKIANEIYPKEN